MAAQLPKMTLPDFIKAVWRILAGRPQTPPSLEGNELLKIIHNRRSIRRFKQREISEDVFAAILEAGRLAPSTVNLQTWSFAIFNAETWQAAFNQTIPFRAQRAIIVMGDTHRNRAVLDTFPQSPLIEYTVSVMNASLASMNMNLAAESLGVSSVMLSETGRSGLLDPGYLKQKLNLPDNVIPIMTIIFGYANKAYPPMPPKLPLNQICFTGAYKEADPRVLEDWMMQMTAGYKASFPLSSLDAQLNVYKSKIVNAEKDLNRMVIHK
jgi:nitroreductase